MKRFYPIDRSSAPKISINIAVYNEQKNIERCLKSIFMQNYPKDKLEVLIVDGGSVDGTLDIARKYPVKIIHNPKRTCAAGRTLGFVKATGEFHIYLDADMEFCGNNWLQRMVFPLLEDKDIVASFAGHAVDKSDSPLNRYFSYHEAFLHPFLEFFSPAIVTTIVEERKNYFLCKFSKEHLPFVGITLYRMDALRSILAEKGEKWGWIEPEVNVLAVQKGYDKFAYAPIGFYHHAYQRLKCFAENFRRDMLQTFLPTLGKRTVTYVNFDSVKDVLKFFGWILYANLFIPEFFRGLLTSLLKKDWVFMYRPLIAYMVTDYSLFLSIGTPKGRYAMKSFIKQFAFSLKRRSLGHRSSNTLLTLK